MTGHLSWRKSSHSGDEGGNCLEMAAGPAAVHIRDSKEPGGPVVTCTPASWRAWTAWTARPARRAGTARHA